MKINEVLAHCDIPCKIYDPIVIQIAALTVVRIIDIIEEKNLDTSKIDDSAELARLINEKENQAKIVKDETRIIWGDYFKDPQIEANPNVHSLVHSIMMQGSKCKQGLDRKNAETLVDLVNEFSEIFWSTKDVPTKRVTAPYPPALEMVVPNIQMPKPFKVSGNSMSPTIKDGDFLTISARDDYKVNDIVVLDLPELGFIVKRIKLKEHNSVRVIGDNPLLESSACDQMHPLKNIVGKVTKVN